MFRLQRPLSASILLVLLVISAAGQGDPAKPVRGRSYTVSYGPVTKPGMGTDLSVVYAFDYWGTKASDDRNPVVLYSNVTDPDSGRAYRASMKKRGRAYTASIDIPANATLLSYYITDGIHMDDNGGKTFVQYICDANGHPVMGARFRNIDFLVIAGRSPSEQAAELAAELEEYPQNHLAYVPYWMLRFESVTSLDSLQRLKPVFENTLSLMSHVVSADTVQNVRAGIYFRYARRLGVLANATYREVLRDVEATIESIPEERRSVYLKGILAGIKEGRYDH